MTANHHRSLRLAAAVVFMATCVAVAATLVVTTEARAGVKPEHVRKARAACKPQHVEHCRRMLIRALAAVEWQRHDKQAEVSKMIEQTRGKQPYAYAARLAYFSCLSFAADPSRCRPPSEMLNVGRCESGLQRADPNPVSTALGWTQWLDGTWYAHPIGAAGFNRLDVIAMGLATEALVYHDHGWHEWVCQP